MNIVITGASKGIGFETAKILSKDHRVLAISRNWKLLQKLKSSALEYKRPEKSNSGIEIFKMDISDKTNISELKAFVEKHFSIVDILINNAAILIKKPFNKISEEDVQATFGTNLFGIIRLIQLLHPFIKRSKMPHIVNVGSMGGFQGSVKFPELSLYSASKASIACLTECLAQEFKEDNISVNCLALGSVQTEMLSKAFPGFKAPLNAKQMAGFISEFSISGQRYFNGKVLPVSVDTP